MTHRIRAAFSRVLRDSSAPNDVHFHQGSGTEPAVCFDARCQRPQMDVRS